MSTFCSELWVVICSPYFLFVCIYLFSSCPLRCSLKSDVAFSSPYTEMAFRFCPPLLETTIIRVSLSAVALRHNERLIQSYLSCWLYLNPATSLTSKYIEQRGQYVRTQRSCADPRLQHSESTTTSDNVRHQGVTFAEQGSVTKIFVTNTFVFVIKRKHRPPLHSTLHSLNKK